MFNNRRYDNSEYDGRRLNKKKFEYRKLSVQKSRIRGKLTYPQLSATVFFIELIFALIITRIPLVRTPFNWLESYFHELSHGIAALISGGDVISIQLFTNGAGLCLTQGGWPVLIGFAGYFGAACWGYLIFFMATWPKRIRGCFTVLALLVTLSTFLWARDPLTIVILISLVALLLLPLKLAANRLLVSLLRVIGLVIMLNALTSPLVLLGLNGTGDAVFLASITWFPSLFWVGLWLLNSSAVIFLAWRRVARIS